MNSLMQLSIVAHSCLGGSDDDYSDDSEYHEERRKKQNIPEIYEKIEEDISPWIGTPSLPYPDHNYARPLPTSLHEESKPVEPTTLPLLLDAAAVGEADARKDVGSTETWEGSVTRCICEFQHDDGYMICCDKCSVWQHVDCMGVDRQNIPDTYLCELCKPRPIDKHHAIRCQARKRELLMQQQRADSSDTDTEEDVKSRKMTMARRRRRSRHSSAGGASQVPGQRRRSQQDAVRTRGQSSFPFNKGDKKCSRHLLKQTGNGNNSCLSSPNPRLPMSPALTPVSMVMGQDYTSFRLLQPCRNAYTSDVRRRLVEVSSSSSSSSSSSLDRGVDMTAYSSTNDSFHEFSLVTVSMLQISTDIKTQGLEANKDIKSEEPIIEYTGKVMLKEQCTFSGSTTHVMQCTIKGFPNLDVCIDSSHHDNQAKFIRRSANPNARLRHFFDANDNLRFCIWSTTHILKGSEVTLPLEYENRLETGRAMFDHTKVEASNQPVQKRKRRQSSSHMSESSALSDVPVELGGCTIAATARIPDEVPEPHVPDEGSTDLPRPSLGSPEDPASPGPVKSKAQREGRRSEADRLLHPYGNSRRRKSSAARSPDAAESKVGPRERSTKQTKKEESRSEDLRRSSTEGQDAKKLTREEKKLEAIMKAFERIDKKNERKIQRAERRMNDPGRSKNHRATKPGRQTVTKNPVVSFGRHRGASKKRDERTKPTSGCDGTKVTAIGNSERRQQQHRLCHQINPGLYGDVEEEGGEEEEEEEEGGGGGGGGGFHVVEKKNGFASEEEDGCGDDGDCGRNELQRSASLKEGKDKEHKTSPDGSNGSSTFEATNRNRRSLRLNSEASVVVHRPKDVRRVRRRRRSRSSSLEGGASAGHPAKKKKKRRRKSAGGRNVTTFGAKSVPSPGDDEEDDDDDGDGDVDDDDDDDDDDQEGGGGGEEEEEEEEDGSELESSRDELSNDESENSSNFQGGKYGEADNKTTTNPGPPSGNSQQQQIGGAGQVVDSSQGFAKKRWLRQAINESSENSQSLVSESGFVTPLKKRRLTVEGAPRSTSSPSFSPLAPRRLPSLSDDFADQTPFLLHVGDKVPTFQIHSIPLDAHLSQVEQNYPLNPSKSQPPDVSLGPAGGSRLVGADGGGCQVPPLQSPAPPPPPPNGVDPVVVPRRLSFHQNDREMRSSDVCTAATLSLLLLLPSSPTNSVATFTCVPKVASPIASPVVTSSSSSSCSSSLLSPTSPRCLSPTSADARESTYRNAAAKKKVSLSEYRNRMKTTSSTASSSSFISYVSTGVATSPVYSIVSSAGPVSSHRSVDVGRWSFPTVVEVPRAEGRDVRAISSDDLADPRVANDQKKSGQWDFEETAAEKILTKSLSLTDRLRFEFGLDAQEETETSVTPNASSPGLVVVQSSSASSLPTPPSLTTTTTTMVAASLSVVETPPRPCTSSPSRRSSGRTTPPPRGILRRTRLREESSSFASLLPPPPPPPPLQQSPALRRDMNRHRRHHQREGGPPLHPPLPLPLPHLSAHHESSRQHVPSRCAGEDPGISRSRVGGRRKQDPPNEPPRSAGSPSRHHHHRRRYPSPGDRQGLHYRERDVLDSRNRNYSRNDQKYLKYAQNSLGFSRSRFQHQ